MQSNYLLDFVQNETPICLRVRNYGLCMRKFYAQCQNMQTERRWRLQIWTSPDTYPLSCIWVWKSKCNSFDYLRSSVTGRRRVPWELRGLSPLWSCPYFELGPFRANGWEGASVSQRPKAAARVSFVRYVWVPMGKKKDICAVSWEVTDMSSWRKHQGIVQMNTKSVEDRAVFA